MKFFKIIFSEEEIDSLAEQNLSLQREVFEKELKIASFSCDLEVDHARKAFLKKIASKDEDILDLKMEISSLKTDNDSLLNKVNFEFLLHLKFVMAYTI